MLVALVILSFAPGLSAPGTPAPSAPPRGEEVPTPIQFGDDIDETLRRARRADRPVVLIFGAVWCGACRSFKKHTLANPTVRSVARDYAWVYIDMDRNLTLAREYGVEATPHLFVLAPDGRVLGQALGALEPAALLEFLEQSITGELAGLDPKQVEVIVREGERPARVSWSPDGYRGDAICFSHVGYGPLDLPTQSPAKILRYSLRPRTPSTLRKGQIEVGWTETVANVFAYEPNDFRLDYLSINSILSIAYGLTDTVLLELEYSDVSRFDSVLDPITDAFHDVFGLGDSGRDDFPSGDNIIDLEPRNGIEIEDTDSGSETRDLTLTVQHNLTCGKALWPAFAYGASISYSGGGKASLQGDDRFSYGLSTSLARRIGEDWYAYLSLGYTWHGLDVARGLPLEDEQWAGVVAVEWRYKRDRAWILQVLSSEGVTRDRSPFDKASTEINLGWKKEISLGTVFEVGLVENAFEVDNSPDFGLHFGLKHRF